MRDLQTVAREQLTGAATAVIGIGSCHGDDRVGWEVVDQLACRPRRSVRWYKASVPHDLLNWLEPTCTTHIIDAYLDTSGTCRRFEVRAGENNVLSAYAASEPGSPPGTVRLPDLRSASTHKIDLLSTLSLAFALGKLPERLILWVVPIANIERCGPLTKPSLRMVGMCVDQLTDELSNA